MTTPLKPKIIAPCGCSYSDDEEPFLCTICTEHICKGSVSNYKIRTICYWCIKKDEVIDSLQKNETGHYLDPATRQPLSTCKCGKILYAMCPCYMKMMTGAGEGHGPICTDIV